MRVAVPLPLAEATSGVRGPAHDRVGQRDAADGGRCRGVRPARPATRRAADDGQVLGVDGGHAAEASVPARSPV